jgi:hypothetical protein
MDQNESTRKFERLMEADRPTALGRLPRHTPSNGLSVEM